METPLLRLFLGGFIVSEGRADAVIKPASLSLKACPDTRLITLDLQLVKSRRGAVALGRRKAARWMAILFTADLLNGPTPHGGAQS